MYAKKFFKYKLKYQQLAGTMYKPENRQLFERYKNRDLDQQQFTKHLFENQYPNNSPFFYEKWLEHLNFIHQLNRKHNPIMRTYNKLSDKYRSESREPDFSNFYSPDENITAFAHEFHNHGLQWDNQRMEKWFKSSFYFSLAKKIVGSSYSNNDIYNTIYQQLKSKYPLLANLGILVQRLKIILEVLADKDKTSKIYAGEGGYASLSSFTEICYQYLALFLSLTLETYRDTNRDTNRDTADFRQNDINQLYHFFQTLDNEGNDLLIFYIHEISQQLFD